MKNWGGRKMAGNAAELFREVYLRMYNEVNGTRYGRAAIPRFDGGVASDGRKYKAIWPKVAQKLLDAGIDVEDYLIDILSREKITSPQEAVRDIFIRRYKTEMESDSSVRDTWDSEENILRQNIQLRMNLGEDVYMALTGAVCDPGLGVSPLTRYLFSVINNRNDLAQGFETDARIQYQRRRAAYNRWCPERIPEEWKETHGDRRSDVGDAAFGSHSDVVQYL